MQHTQEYDLEELMVADFMQQVEQALPPDPTLVAYPYELRMKLIIEEALEFVEACGYVMTIENGDVITSAVAGHVEVNMSRIRLVRISDPDIEKMIDALCDLKYVLIGAALALGVSLVPFMRAVHVANMTKIGGPVRADGKLQKPEGWQPPDIRGVLANVLRKRG